MNDENVGFNLITTITIMVPCSEDCENNWKYYRTKMLNIWETDACSNLWDYVSEMLSTPRDMLVFLKLTSEDDATLCTKKFEAEYTLWTKIRSYCEECKELSDVLSKSDDINTNTTIATSAVAVNDDDDDVVAKKDIVK